MTFLLILSVLFNLLHYTMLCEKSDIIKKYVKKYKIKEKDNNEYYWDGTDGY